MQDTAVERDRLKARVAELGTQLANLETQHQEGIDAHVNSAGQFIDRLVKMERANAALVKALEQAATRFELIACGNPAAKPDVGAADIRAALAKHGDQS